MITRTYMTVAALVGAALIATAAFATTKPLSAQEFVTKASIANEFEIESSKLALAQSQNAEVQKFAQKMIDDHTATAEKLNETLSSSDSHAQAATALDEKHQQKIAQLQSLSGADFDRQYIDMQTGAHKHAIQLFSDYSAHGKDPALRKFAKSTLPDLKKHLQHVQQLNTNS